MSDTTIEKAFQLLSINAVIFSALSGLFGVYLVLFILAVWSTYRRASKANTHLRLVTLLLFGVLCAHYAARAVTFGQHRSLAIPKDEELAWFVPLLFVGGVSTTVAGLISDGLLAWRVYILYGQTKLALYLPAFAVIVTALIGCVGDFLNLAAYHNVVRYEDYFEVVSLKNTAAWGWIMLGTNTILTASIIGRIILTTRTTNRHAISTRIGPSYSTIVEAIVESALVTWIGLLLDGIARVAPQGHITENMDVGFVMTCIIPIFFGISQCLMTVRLGLAHGPESPGAGTGIRSAVYNQAARNIAVDAEKISKADSITESDSGEREKAVGISGSRDFD